MSRVVSFASAEKKVVWLFFPFSGSLVQIMEESPPMFLYQTLAFRVRARQTFEADFPKKIARFPCAHIFFLLWQSQIESVFVIELELFFHLDFQLGNSFLSMRKPPRVKIQEFFRSFEGKRIARERKDTLLYTLRPSVAEIQRSLQNRKRVLILRSLSEFPPLSTRFRYKWEKTSRMSTPQPKQTRRE